MKQRVLQKSLQDNFKFLTLSGNDFLTQLKTPDIGAMINEMEDYFLTMRSSIELESSVTFGMEIEFEKAEYDESYKELKKLKRQGVDYRWGIKGDSTVATKNIEQKSCGGEIVSPKLIDTPKTWVDLENVCLMLQRLKATAEHLAGGHIHFGAQILGNNHTYWVNMIKLWTVYERVIFRFSYGDKLGPRENVFHCAKPLANTFYRLLGDIERKDNVSDILTLLSTSADKQSCVNLSNINYKSSLQYKKTVEIRCPNSSVNPVVWQNNVNFFARLFLYCKSSDFDYDFIESRISAYNPWENTSERYSEIHLQEAMELCDLIFSSNLDKIYFLKQYLKSSMVPKTREENIRQVLL